MSAHITISDKDRGPNGVGPGQALGLIEDGEWHWYSIRDLDGKVKRCVVVPDGTYDVKVAQHGNILTLGPTDIEFHLTRYHFDGKGALNGNIVDGEEGERFHDSTAWDSIATSRRVKNEWFGTGGGKVVVKAGSTEPTEAHGVGVCYRVDGGSYNRDGLILKFIRLAD